jgi:katanin p60 ATPase-containing subunit A1
VIGIIENKPKAIEAWNTILFYGPPGTGKTLMAAAVAKNIDATFFDVKVSQILSKYYGELLAELDGSSSKTSDKKFVLVIAATNTPEAIDEAVMSRFGKKIEIPLPDFAACREILKIHTEKKGIGLEDERLYDKLANYCVGHKMSGRDITFLCTEAIWKMLDEMNPGSEKLAEEPYETIRAYELKTRMVNQEDFGLKLGGNK